MTKNKIILLLHLVFVSCICCNFLFISVKADATSFNDLKEYYESQTKLKYGDDYKNYEYTFVFESNSGNGKMDDKTFWIKSGSKSSDSEVLPKCEFNAPFLHKFSNWAVFGKYFKEGDEIDGSWIVQQNLRDVSKIRVKAIWDIDYNAIICFCMICLVCLLIVGLIIFVIYKFHFNANKGNLKLNTNTEKMINRNKSPDNWDKNFDEKLIKYKNLLDKNIISQEEFEKKKKDLLNL